MKRLAMLVLAISPVCAFAENLAEVYNIAKTQDPALKVAQATRDQNKQAVPIAKANLQPKVSSTGDLTFAYQQVDSSSAGKFDQDFISGSASVSLTYPLYRRNYDITLEQAMDVSNQADADYATAQQDLILRTAQAYFNVLAAFDSVEFAQSEKKAIERQLDQAQQRFDVGLVAITDVHEAQARFDQARANEIVAYNGLDNSREALREIIGSVPGNFKLLKEEVPLSPPTPANLDDWDEIASRQNPSLASARRVLEAARKEVGIQRTGNDPTLDFVAGLDMSRSDSRLAADTDTGSIGLQLTVPIYTGGAVDAAVKRSEFAYQSALNSLEVTRRSISRSVRDSYRGVMSSISRVRALEAARRSAESALEATEAGFDVGTRTLVDVLNGQRDLFRARRDYSQSRYEYILNTLTLFQAAGALGEDDVVRVNSWLK